MRWSGRRPASASFGRRINLENISAPDHLCGVSLFGTLRSERSNLREWRTALPAKLSAIDRYCIEFQRWRQTHCSALDASCAELLLRAALTNAVVHGCGEDARKRISCLVRARSRSLVIAIHDAGEGFDWRTEWDRGASISNTRCKGIQTLRRHANAVRFNPQGNAVALVKRF
jgi:anti-sigma regulatory factor (Ser/Thr protein kinase)